MPNPINVGGVVGTDNVQPIYNPSALWQTWNINDIYMGGVAANKHVPKINDVVVQIVGSQITEYIVTEINLTTMVPTLQQVRVNELSGTLEEEDLLLTTGIPRYSDTYRLLVDSTVQPHRILVDERCRIGAVQASGVKIFRGADISNTGVVISQTYDAGGNYSGNTLPLELLTLDNVTNSALKSVGEGYTTANLSDNELVTAVIYASNGAVLSHRQLLVENTGFIRPLGAATKYVVGITLESPFLSTSDLGLIEFPYNLPLSGLELMGVVHYSNGDVQKYPVNGSKFSIYGFDEYISTQSGQGVNLVLKYTLDATEHTNITTSADGKSITKAYRAKTLSADGTYGVKLYPYPVWVDFVHGWRLQWFLLSLSRSVWYDVTSNVNINAVYAPYDPTAYGQVQTLSVSINMNAVNGIYQPYIHTQTVEVVLARQGTERVTPWMIGFTPNQTPRYGVDTHATAKFINTNRYEVKVDFGQTLQSSWLDKLYYQTLPLYSPGTESGPLVPTHFAVMVDGSEYIYTLDQWNQTLTINKAMTNGSTIYVRFMRQVGQETLQLSIAGLPLWFVDAQGVVIV